MNVEERRVKRQHCWCLYAVFVAEALPDYVDGMLTHQVRSDAK